MGLSNGKLAISCACCWRDPDEKGPTSLAAVAGVMPRTPRRSWLREVIRESPIFIHVANSNLDDLVSDFEGPTLVRPGTVLFHQGETISDGEPGLYVLGSGIVDVFVAKAGQARPGALVYTFSKPGQTFGSGACLSGLPRSATIVANSEATIWSLTRESFNASMGDNDAQRIVARHEEAMASVGFDGQSLSSKLAIFNVNLFEGPHIMDNLNRYYAICRRSKELSLTSSCFTPWHKHKKQNGYAKVIPAMSCSNSDPVRVFFFDDNIEWDGKENNAGIVNLRDVQTGKFVEFGHGTNGFVHELASVNSVVAYSSDYRNVLVQVNILDAMEDEDFFVKIIDKYTKPGEKVIAFMDCNATIVSMDSISGKDNSEVLLGTMFQMIKVEPQEPFQFEWPGRVPVTVEKAMDLKQLVKKVAGQENEFYTHFFKWSNCMRVLENLDSLTKVKWANRREKPFKMEEFQTLYEHYLKSLCGSSDEDGITQSWYKVYKYLIAGGHSLVLNSFGVDTRKVILKTVSDERRVLQMIVNVELWGPKDIKAFENIYELSLPKCEGA
mmetsp:Transcript_157609/g.278157  ORF Transcript_157609/g.278157 Transcript_157609/m.278157 type:complete len:553 (+) Transcript_157609:104-1762(+)